MNRGIAFLASVAALAIPGRALGDEPGDCPPGAWFCDESEQVPVEPDATEPAEPPAAPERPEPPRQVEVPKRTPKHPPPIVVYHPYDEPPPVVVVGRDGGSVRAFHRRPRREWGINLRLEGVMMGSDRDRHPDSGMGGIGGSLRYRPVPHFALDVGLDFLGGVDWLGNPRSETALLVSGMLFFNPKSKVQVYALGGFGFSGARVRRDVRYADDGGYVYDDDPTIDAYSYFGGHLGGGLEFRVGKKTALNLDVVGFVRGRTDDTARDDPEFIDAETGRRTNTSGGGLFRGGITFYW